VRKIRVSTSVPPRFEQYKPQGNTSNLVQSHFGSPALKWLESGIAHLVPWGFYPAHWGMNQPPPSPCVWYDSGLLIRSWFVCVYMHMWHDSFISVTWLVHMCGMTRSNVWHNLFICVIWLWSLDKKIISMVVCVYVTWLVHTCDMTRSYACRDSFMCVTWVVRVRDMTRSCAWHDSSLESLNHKRFVFWMYVHETWLIHMCDMTPSYVWHYSLICVTWLVHMCDMTRSYVWRDSSICVTWLVNKCDVTHSHVWHDLFIYVTWLWSLNQKLVRVFVNVYVTWLMYFVPWLVYVIRLYLWHDSFIRVMWIVHI